MHRYLLLLVVGSFATGAALQACSGDSGQSDGGPDATADTASDVTPDTTPTNDAENDAGSDAASTCPTYTGSSTFCQASVAHCMTCGAAASTPTCALPRFTEFCDDVTGALSTQCLNMEVAAWTAGSCDASVACDSTSLADASPTAAQTKAATDYCAMCGDSGACVASVISSLSLKVFSDTLCNSIDQTCTPDASTSAACNKYATCALGLANAQFNNVLNFCKDAGGD